MNKSQQVKNYMNWNNTVAGDRLATFVNENIILLPARPEFSEHPRTSHQNGSHCPLWWYV